MKYLHRQGIVIINQNIISSNNFLTEMILKKWKKRADILITHGGTGAIIGAVKKGKKVIAIPRLAKYGEHVDNHQMQIIKQFSEMNLIYGLLDCDRLEEALKNIKMHKFNSYQSCTQYYIENIDSYIKNEK